MGRKMSANAISRSVDSMMETKRDRKCPLSWRAKVKSDESSVEVSIKYLAHSTADDLRRPKEHELYYLFDKTEIIDMIPDEAYQNKFLIVNYAKSIDDKRWEVRKKIEEMLCDDFEKLQSTTKSVSKMYNTMLDVFAEGQKYQLQLDFYARLEAILALLKKPKTFYGDDIRDYM